MSPTLPLILCLLTVREAAQRNPVFTGIVDKIIDGDTLRVKVDGKQEIVVDLWAIDAPQPSQPFGREATAYLTKLALNRTVIVEYYGAFSDVYVNLPDRQVLANERMAAAGYAWFHLSSAGEDLGGKAIADRYRKAEQSARSAKRGLWSRPDPIAPWCWPGERTSGDVIDEYANADKPNYVFCSPNRCILDRRDRPYSPKTNEQPASAVLLYMPS